MRNILIPTFSRNKAAYAAVKAVDQLLRFNRVEQSGVSIKADKMKLWLLVVFIGRGLALGSSYPFLLHFEAGTNGQRVSASVMSNAVAATPAFAGAVLQTSGATNNFFLSSAASHPFDSGYSWAVNGTNNGAGTLGMKIDMTYSNSVTEDVTWLFFSVCSNYSFGFYFWTTVTGQVFETCLYDLVYLAQPYNPSTENLGVALFVPSLNPSFYWRAHGVSNNVSVNGGNIYGMQPTDTNWITGRVTPTNFTLTVYNPFTWQQVGSNSSIGFGGNGNFDRIEILNYLRCQEPGKWTYIDNFIVDNTATFPLLPTNSSRVLPDLGYATIQGAIANANPGDTIILPAGFTNWGSTLVWSNKPLTLRGAGAMQTIITNTQTGATGSQQKQCILIYAPTNGFCRVSNIGFDGNRTNNLVEVDGVSGQFVFGNPWPVVRIDHCQFANSPFTGCLLFNTLTAAVVDHCQFFNNDIPYNVYAGGALLSASWKNPLTLGTTNCIVAEDCYFENDQPYLNYSAAMVSSRGIGCRDTFRFNIWSNSASSTFAVFDIHGDLGTANYGTRQCEVYGNTFVSSAGNDIKLLDIRGGTCLIYSNTFLGSVMKTNLYAREEDEPVYGVATNYPGLDQHWLWMWQNVSRGVPITNLEYGYPATDPKYLLEGTNVFWTAPSAATAPITNYAPLVYPHPLVTAQDAYVRPSPPKTLRFNSPP